MKSFYHVTLIRCLLYILPDKQVNKMNINGLKYVLKALRELNTSLVLCWSKITVDVPLLLLLLLLVVLPSVWLDEGDHE